MEKNLKYILAHTCWLLLSVCLIGASAEETILRKCPGAYCGRTVEGGNSSDCGACPRGSRPDGASLCRECTNEPAFYDWLYLAFMALLAPSLHCFFIDFTNKRKNGGLIILHVSAVLESCVAAVCTLLLSEPRGSLHVKSCPVYYLSDWYTMLYNPTPDYTTTLYCTQEVVYPLYTIVMIYYAFGLIAMMIVRPILSAKFFHGRGSKSIYAALYFFPILVVVQAVFAGLLYYSFPYITLVLSIITSAAHFAYFEVQDVRYLISQNLTSVRNLMILICHWLLHAFGIIAITELKEPAFHGSLLCLVPFPSLFYLITVKYTDPVKIKAEIQY